ncbi:FAD-dependent oxidoreductase [Paludisphaera mucosa]|uniref:FAD-dependent oxidoreductase n=1 Tax=Paludisphaera mucosa TaxID=3030827 RepID=A0ABT6FH71_9BACT|nr:FAD-dependent oxidoreductase [Paludisphaera mucosa]MDG3006890.1 FAD-dependent oxidoreductase [Paludisphaera mucosa]
MTTRRELLRRCGRGLSLLPWLAASAPRREALAGLAAPRGEIAADLVIVGGGVGGVAAALAALRSGLRVVLTEPTDWIGGQLTSQAVPPDEHPWIEQFGSSTSYRGYRTGVRDYYKRTAPLTAEALANPFLNPGGGGVSRLCHEPRVSLAVLTDLLAHYASLGRLLTLLEHEPVRAEVQGDRVRAVSVRNRRTGAEITLTAPYFLDATELGDLLPMAGVEHVVGAESRAETGEPHALDAAAPGVQQAFTVCFPMEHRPGEDHTIDRPEEYDFWRGFVPELSPPWPGKLLDLSYTHPITLKANNQGFDPTGKGKGLWLYRRILDPSIYRPGVYDGGGVTLVNWPQNDYLLGPLVAEGQTSEQAEAHVRRAKQLSLSLLYWMQTECPRPDGGTGWKGLRLRPDMVGTDDGLAKAPYVRESRRIRAEFTVTENHVGTEARRKATGAEDVAAEPFWDSVGVGSYRIDLHPATGGKNYVDVSSLPFQIPLGALLPVRVENLLPACKNLGVTHISNGCYRLHPVEWQIGEAAGALVAHCLAIKEPPKAVRADRKRFDAFQDKLKAQGVDVAWPKLTPR